MTSSALSRIRVFFSIVVLVLFASVFIDFLHVIPEKYINILTYLQFIPSGIKLFTAKGLLAFGALAILVLTLLSGRIYCSFLCPLGIVQDLNSRAGGKIKKRFRRFGYKKPHTIIRHSLLVLTIIVSLIWGIYAITFLDPYSIFGRIFTYFVKPLVLFANNYLAGLFGKHHIYTFVDTPLTSFPLAAYAVPAAFVILIGTLSLIRGRLYCNTFCPVGTFLGLISRFSIFRVKFNDDKCTRCGRCALSCKSSCIDFLNKDIDMSRCVACFNCLKSCPEKAISYGLTEIKRKQVEEVDNERRKVIVGSALFLLGMSASASGQKVNAPKPTKASTVKELRKNPVCPPGSSGIENFTSKCTACSLCITECPNDVLIPSVKEYGLSGIMQPRLDYHKGFCAYECVRCLEICPTGALMPLEVEAKKLTQLGKAVFIRENCIVKTEKTACGACSESCPTKAVHMVPYEAKLLIPQTDDSICIGCGHCEFACPTTPYKAIFVDGNQEHRAAKKPENKKSDIKKPVDFPF